MGKLNSLTVQRAIKPGLIGDGDGLYLQVSKTGTKSWIFRFMLNKRSRTMGLGAIELVSLAEARSKALECRKLLLDGIDPIDSRLHAREAKLIEAATAMTFDQCAAAYIDAHSPSWKNDKHREQWKSSLRNYASPLIGRLPVGAVDTALVMRVLESIWYQKTETASRLRNRIELILAWATVRGHRTGDNPARWRGHLEQLLPKRSSIQKVKHFAALPVSEMGAFMKCLREQESVAALGLEFQILTAARTGEVIGARWEEINFAESVWVVPASRMKAKREHRVPLSPRALDVLEKAKSYAGGELIFPGRSGTKPLSNMAFLAILQRQMGLDITAHGFRSTFRDWAAEHSSFARDVVEMALAHSIKDATEAAYRRGDLLLKRRALMNEWAKFCQESGKYTSQVLALATRSELNA